MRRSQQEGRQWHGGVLCSSEGCGGRGGRGRGSILCSFAGCVGGRDVYGGRGGGLGSVLLFWVSAWLLVSVWEPVLVVWLRGGLFCCSLVLRRFVSLILHNSSLRLSLSCVSFLTVSPSCAMAALVSSFNRPISALSWWIASFSDCLFSLDSMISISRKDIQSWMR